MNSNISHKSDAPSASTTGNAEAHSDFDSTRTRWLTHLRHIGRSPSSIATYNAAVLNLQRYLARRGVSRVEDVAHDFLVAWQTTLGADNCSPATLNLFARTARGFFRWLYGRGELFADPSVGLPIPKVPQPIPRCPNQEQVALLLGSIRGQSRMDLRNRALMEVAYSSAARLGELHRLDVRSVDLESGLVRLLGKGDRERVSPLGQTACEALQSYLRNGRPNLLRPKDQTNALWVSTRGGRLGRAAIEQIVARCAAACGLMLTPHDLRRASATHLMQNGMSLAFIKELLGHADYSHLRHYLRSHPAQALADTKNTKPLRR